MANIINTSVVTANGTEYPTGIYVKHSANFGRIEQGTLILRFTFYKDKQAFEDNKMPIHPVFKGKKAQGGMLIKKLTPEEIAQLTPVKVQEYATAYLKEVYGGENIIEI